MADAGSAPGDGAEPNGGGAAVCGSGSWLQPEEGSSPPWELLLELFVLLVVLPTIWLLVYRGLINTAGNGGTWTARRLATVCTLRIIAASVAAACAPVHLPLLSWPLLPWPFRLLPSGSLLYFSTEVLLLAALALLLPLPLAHHLWAQALALRSALARMRRVATLHSSLPHCAVQCLRILRGARLAMLAVVPGHPPQLPALHPLQSCWMLHVWVTVVVGYGLPVAVQAALTTFAEQQVTRREQRQQWEQQLQQAQQEQQQQAREQQQQREQQQSLERQQARQEQHKPEQRQHEQRQQEQHQQQRPKHEAQQRRQAEKAHTAAASPQLSARLRVFAKVACRKGCSAALVDLLGRLPFPFRMLLDMQRGRGEESKGAAAVPVPLSLPAGYTLSGMLRRIPVSPPSPSAAGSLSRSPSPCSSSSSSSTGPSCYSWCCCAPDSALLEDACSAEQQLTQCLAAPLMLAATLAHNVLLLVPCAALLWALLEVAAYFV